MKLLKECRQKSIRNVTQKKTNERQKKQPLSLLSYSVESESCEIQSKNEAQ